MDTALASTNSTTARVTAILARARALGWSQNRLARRIRKDSGHVSKVFLGKAVSSRVFVLCEAALEREEQRRGA